MGTKRAKAMCSHTESTIKEFHPYEWGETFSLNIPVITCCNNNNIRITILDIRSTILEINLICLQYK